MKKIKIFLPIILLIITSVFAFGGAAKLDNGMRVVTEKIDSDRAYITLLFDYSSYDEYIPYAWLPEEWRAIEWLPSYGMPIHGVRQAILNSFLTGLNVDPRQAFMNIGGSINFSITPDYISINVNVPVQTFDAALQSLQSLAARVPNEAAANASLASVRQSFGNNTFSHIALAEIFGNSPYGLFYSNSTSYLVLLRGPMVAVAYEAVIKPPRAILSVASGIDDALVQKSVETAFGKWKDKPDNNWDRLSTSVHNVEFTSKTNLKELGNTLNSHYILSIPLPGHDSDEYPFGFIIAGLFDGIGGEVFKNLRVEEQITYSYSVNLFTNANQNIMQIIIDITSSDFYNTSEIMNKAVYDIIENGVSAEKLLRAKNYAVTKMLASRQIPDILSTENARAILFFNDPKYYVNLIEDIQNTSSEEVNRFVKAYLANIYETVIIPQVIPPAGPPAGEETENAD